MYINRETFCTAGIVCPGLLKLTCCQLSKSWQHSINPVHLLTPKSTNMEQNQQPLFGLSIDGQSKNFLAESAKWGKFLAIIGFIVCALIIILGIFMATASSEMDSAFRQYGAGGSGDFEGLGVVMAVVYILVALIYFFPCLYLLRFSNHMKTALATDNLSSLTTSFQNLKSMFKFVGIFTIVILAFYLLAFIIGLGSKL